MVALATPIDHDGRVDEAGLQRILGHVLLGGIDGVCPVRSTGKETRLSQRERLEVTAIVRAAVPPSMPVIAGVPVNSVSSTRRELAKLGEVGATAALVSPPSYFPSSEEDLINLYRSLANETSVPLVIYNIPQFTKVRVSPAAVAALAAHPNVVGLKDSGRDLDYLQEVVRLTGAVSADQDFRVYTGADTLLVASLLAGADGVIAASANVLPNVCVRICSAVGEGDFAEAKKLQGELAELVATCRRSDGPAAWKIALEVLGLCGSSSVPPCLPLPVAEQDRIRAALSEIGLEVGTGPAFANQQS